MTFVIYALVTLLLSAWVILVWLPGWLWSSCAVAIVLLAYCSGYVQTIAPVRMLILFFSFVLFLVLVTTKLHFLKSKERILIFSVLTVLVGIFCAGQMLVEADGLDPLLRYTLLFPLVGILGFFLSKAHDLFKFARIYVLISSLMGVLAIVERASGSFLVAGAYDNSDRLIRDGSIRSIVFSEHPLVLSVLLLAAFPMVSLSLRRWVPKSLTYLALVGGVLSTNSRGALIILAVWLTLKSASKMGILSAGASHVARIGIVAIVTTAFLGMLFGSGSDAISSSSAIDASAEYRSTLYAFAVRSLSEMPGGWGLNGLPEGVYLVSSYFGTLDISKTVDSELALAVFDFGWLGLIAFIGLMINQLGARNVASSIGQSGIIVTVSGFYLALHAWVGLGTIWMLVIGLSLGATRVSNPKQEPALRPSPQGSQEIESSA